MTSLQTPPSKGHTSDLKYPQDPLLSHTADSSCLNQHATIVMFVLSTKLDSNVRSHHSYHSLHHNYNAIVTVSGLPSGLYSMDQSRYSGFPNVQQFWGSSDPWSFQQRLTRLSLRLQTKQSLPNFCHENSKPLILIFKKAHLLVPEERNVPFCHSTSALRFLQEAPMWQFEPHLQTSRFVGKTVQLTSFTICKNDSSRAWCLELEHL